MFVIRGMNPAKNGFLVFCGHPQLLPSASALCARSGPSALELRFALSTNSPPGKQLRHRRMRTPCAAKVPNLSENERTRFDPSDTRVWTVRRVRWRHRPGIDLRSTERRPASEHERFCVCLFGTGLQLKDTVVIVAPDQWIRLRSLRLLKLQIKNSLTVRFSSIPRQLYRKAWYKNWWNAETFPWRCHRFVRVPKSIIAGQIASKNGPIDFCRAFKPRYTHTAGELALKTAMTWMKKTLTCPGVSPRTVCSRTISERPSRKRWTSQLTETAKCSCLRGAL